MLKHLDLFSGIGGFSLGLELTGGFETVAFCEIEKFPRKILKKHWPNVKQYKDIKELTNGQLETDGIIPIDIITGGYPCQPFSVAGSQRGEKDKRHLWPEMFRLVKECRPTWVIGENVSGHIKLGLDTVLEDLESEGYSTRAFSISASSVGANHKRERVWIVGYSKHNGLSSSTKSRSFKETSDNNKEGKNEAGEFAGAGRSNGDANVEDTRRALRQGSLFEQRMQMKLDKKMPISLNDQVRHPDMMWPTPSAGMWKQDVNDNGRYARDIQKKGYQIMLPAAIKLTKVPTPTARDYKDSGPNTNYEKARRKVV